MEKITHIDARYPINFGDIGEDAITGFKGVVTGITYYWMGCDQILLLPKSEGGDKRDGGQWFDIERVKKIGTHKGLPNLNWSEQYEEKVTPKQIQGSTGGFSTENPPPIP